MNKKEYKNKKLKETLKYIGNEYIDILTRIIENECKNDEFINYTHYLLLKDAEIKRSIRNQFLTTNSKKYILFIMLTGSSISIFGIMIGLFNTLEHITFNYTNIGAILAILGTLITTAALIIYYTTKYYGVFRIQNREQLINQIVDNYNIIKSTISEYIKIYELNNKKLKNIDLFKLGIFSKEEMVHYYNAYKVFTENKNKKVSFSYSELVYILNNSKKLIKAIERKI